MIALLVMTDGRDELLEQTIASAEHNLEGPITRRVIHDDTGDANHLAELAGRYRRYEVIGGAKAGFGGAISRAWAHLAGMTERFVFHLEDDFLFNRSVPLDRMAQVLECNPHLVQVALRRQPWNDEERAAGGIVEKNPTAYSQAGDAFCAWLEHRLFFTTNPSLYRSSLMSHGWPAAEHSEGVFTHQLLEDPHARFGFFGARASGEWVEHIGHTRVGTGY